MPETPHLELVCFPTLPTTLRSGAVKRQRSLSGSLGLTLICTALLCGSFASAQSSSATTAAQPLTLEQALALLTQSPSVAQAQLSVQVAQANLNAARAALGLSISVNGSADYAGPVSTTTSSGTTSTGSTLEGSAGVNVSLGILPWSSNQTGLRTAQRNLALAQARQVQAQNSARLNVVQQYLGAVSAAQDITLAQRTLESRQRQLSVAQTQQQNGNATAQDVLSAQADVQAAQASLAQAQASLDAARLSLGAAVGQPLNDVTFTSQPSREFQLPEVAALVTQARRQREEVIEAQNNLAAAQDNLEQTRRDATLPDLTGNVRYGPTTGGGLSSSLDVKKGTLSAGYTLPLSSSTGNSRLVASVSGSYTVFSPTLKAQVSAAEASVTQAQLSLSVAQQTVELDVRSKYNAAQVGLSSLQTRATQIQVAELGLQTAQARLQAGTGTQDDVTTAELTLARAQQDLDNARVSAQIALLQLLSAAGGAA